MTRQELLLAYKDGKLSTVELQDRLRALKQQPFKAPLSEGQKGLWMLQNVSPDMSSYNIPLCFCIRQKLDIEKFKQACNFILQQYPILTSVFGEEDGIPYQIVQPSQPLAWLQEDISTLESDEILPYLRTKTKEPFSLENGPLMRIQLLSRSEQEHIVLITVHHIIFDGSSSLLLVKTLLGAYRDLSSGKEPGEKPLSTSFNDFVEWEQAMLSSKEGEEHRSYWRQQLSGTLPILELPTDRPRFSSQSSQGQTYTSLLSPELTKGIKSFAQAQHMNFSIVLLGIFKVLVYRYTGLEDIIVGMPAIGRPAERFDSQIGYFINMLPIRSQVGDEQYFSKFIKNLQLTVVDGLDHAAYPFPVLVREINVPRGQTNAPVFQVAFIYQNFLQSSNSNAIEDQCQNSLRIAFMEDIHQEGEFELALEIFDQGDRFTLNIIYDSDLYDISTIQRMMGHYIKLAEEVVNNPNLTLGEYSLMSKEEQATILIDWNATQADYPKDKTIHQLFEEQVERSPENTAVIFEESSLTYRQLNDKANQLARVLREKGVTPNSMVGIMVERSLEMIIGIMGIVKAGGGYLPISPDTPAERISYMLKDSEANIVLTQNRFIHKAHFDGITIDLEKNELYVGEKGNLENVNSPSNIVYVIYTSGSTGKPKGVVIEHHSLINRLHWMQKSYPIEKSDTILQKTPYTFDVSVWELFWWYLQGSRVCFLKPGYEKDPSKIVDEIERSSITTMHFVPSMLNAFLEYMEADIDLKRLSSLIQVFASGEALSLQQVKRFNKLLYERNNTKLINLYGPTEATIDVSYFDCSPGEDLHVIPIGKPIDNCKLYVLDKKRRPQPVGMTGELYIAGDGLARGYLNRPELTTEKFVPDPFVPGERMYLTGDLARWLPDGNIEYLGRIDHQVKIRGFRIELGEIENRLQSYEAIKEAVVITKEGKEGSKYLCGYIVAQEEINVTEVKEYLSKELPEYMIPAYIIQLEKIPLTSSGKADRKALPEPDGSSITTGTGYEAPRNEIENILVEIWQEVLEITNIGINNNFFALGGDSIKAIQVIARLQRRKLKLDVKNLLTNPVIKELSKYVIRGVNELDQGVVIGQVELTPIQKWFFTKNFTNMHHWNQAVMLYNKYGLNETAIRKVFQKIVEHHDILRSTYTINKEEIVQTIRSIREELFTLSVYDFTGDDEYGQKITAESNHIQSSININSGPLVKLGLFRTKEGDHLLIVIHHLVVDGLSWRILLEDFQIAYSQSISNAEIKLPEKTESYIAWAKKLKDYANSKQLLNESGYWHDIENTEIVSLPKDNQIVKDKTGDSEIITSTLSEVETEILLRQVNTAYNTEINDILLTSLGLAFKDWSGIEKVLINLEGHGREQDFLNINIARTVGWFTSIYPVILDFTQTDDISQQIIRIKENLRQIPQKGIGYGISRYLTSSENKGRVILNREPEIIFNYLGQFDQDINKEVFELSRFPSGRNVSQDSERSNALDIIGVIVDGKLSITFNYNKYEYDKNTIQKLSNSFNKNLKNIIEHCMTKEEVQITPSDTTAKSIDLEEFDKILKEYQNNLA
jgi:amino acid adenylation domain-containing protein/non-ribosomal peptide synthase protein (TIGR01720 family)